MPPAVPLALSDLWIHTSPLGSSLPSLNIHPDGSVVWGPNNIQLLHTHHASWVHHSAIHIQFPGIYWHMRDDADILLAVCSHGFLTCNLLTALHKPGMDAIFCLTAVRRHHAFDVHVGQSWVLWVLQLSQLNKGCLVPHLEQLIYLWSKDILWGGWSFQRYQNTQQIILVISVTQGIWHCPAFVLMYGRLSE